MRAALVGVVAALVLGVFEVLPQWQTLQELRTQSEQRPATMQETPPAREVQAVSYLATHARQDIAISTLLSDLTALAARQGVRIEAVEQAPRSVRELPVRVVALNTTVSASYPALRAFMAEALRTHPQLGLESWSASLVQERGRTAVKAELRWVVLRWTGERAVAAYRADQPRLEAATQRDLFGVQGATLKPAKATAPLVAAAPATPRTAAPEVMYLGRLALDGAQQAMVDAGGQSLLLKVGDAVAGGYRIAAFDDDGLTLTHTVSGEQWRLMRGQGGK